MKQMQSGAGEVSSEVRFVIAVCYIAAVASYTPVMVSSVGVNCNLAQNASVWPGTSWESMVSNL
jgi:hypothetical protein